MNCFSYVMYKKMFLSFLIDGKWTVLQYNESKQNFKINTLICLVKLFRTFVRVRTFANIFPPQLSTHPANLSLPRGLGSTSNSDLSRTLIMIINIQYPGTTSNSDLSRTQRKINNIEEKLQTLIFQEPRKRSIISRNIFKL